MTTSEATGGAARQWRQPAAILRHRLGGDAAPGVGLDLGQNRGGSPRRSRAEQSKLGTSLSKSVPLNEQYSLTLQNGYNLVQQGFVPVPGIVGIRRAATKPTSRPS